MELEGSKGTMGERIAVVGLGYVGLPVALAFGRHFPNTVGFDVDENRILGLRSGRDRHGDVAEKELGQSKLTYTNREEDLKGSTFFVVAVPTPVDVNNRPDLEPLLGATKLVGRYLSKGGLIVFESTVYPGVTEDICGPVLEQISGLKCGRDFTLGYSPERINPGDQNHTLERVVKVVAGQDEKTLERVASIYGAIIPAGVHRAPSIKVAEAAKVIENTQRDLNIALMNELSIIFDRMNISTRDVLAAARTKWNFLPFSPGLVGGHCIGVDPYYLTTIAEQLGYHPQVILAGRRINDGMGNFVAQKIIKLLVQAGVQIKGARVGILGVTFKEDISDVRNSRVPTIYRELAEFGAQPMIHDPMADSEGVEREYGIRLVDWAELSNMDGLIVAVAHREYLERPLIDLTSLVKRGGVFVDVKAMFDQKQLRSDLVYWSL